MWWNCHEIRNLKNRDKILVGNQLKHKRMRQRKIMEKYYQGEKLRHADNFENLMV